MDDGRWGIKTWFERAVYDNVSSKAPACPVVGAFACVVSVKQATAADKIIDGHASIWAWCGTSQPRGNRSLGEDWRRGGEHAGSIWMGRLVFPRRSKHVALRNPELHRDGRRIAWTVPCRPASGPVGGGRGCFSHVCSRADPERGEGSSFQTPRTRKR